MSWPCYAEEFVRDAKRGSVLLSSENHLRTLHGNNREFQQYILCSAGLVFLFQDEPAVAIFAFHMIHPAHIHINFRMTEHTVTAVTGHPACVHFYGFRHIPVDHIILETGCRAFICCYLWQAVFKVNWN